MLKEFFQQQAAAYQKQNQQRFRSKLRGTNPVEIRLRYGLKQGLTHGLPRLD
jgi:hypothetical protein